MIQGVGFCEDGNSCTADSCDETLGCVHEILPDCCGNQLVEGAEDCDDGNTVNGDGCSSACENETYPEDCVAILKTDPTSENGVYFIDPDGVGGAPPLEVWCDMEKGGWAMLLSATSGGTYWGNGSPNWDKAGTDGATGYLNEETHQTAYGSLPTQAIRLCYQDSDHCYDFKHNSGISLQEFFTGGITYTAFSTNTVGVSDTGIPATLDAYSAAMGVAIGSGDASGNDGIYCDWLGINLPASTSAIGWLHDENAGCVTGVGTPKFMDDGAFGLGLNSCFDTTNCFPGGTGNLNGTWRNAFGAGIEGWGESGPWFVLGRSTFCGDGAVDPDEPCDDGNMLNGDGCSNTCQVECENLTCTDNNPCTDESCDAINGCVSTANSPV